MRFDNHFHFSAIKNVFFYVLKTKLVVVMMCFLFCQWLCWAPREKRRNTEVFTGSQGYDEKRKLFRTNSFVLAH